MRDADRGRLELILVFTGPGAGKTSACAGHAVRALGRDISVVFAQFMKRPDQAGEQRTLARLLGENYLAAGRGFFRREEEREEHRREVLRLLSWLRGRDAGVVILDEAIYALNVRLLSIDELSPWLERRGSRERHLILSGRGASDELIALADFVTVMECRKHYYQNGAAALPGLEY